MRNITINRLKMVSAAAERMWLAARGDLEYLDCDAWDDDCAIILDLVSDSRDACWPALEERARLKATIDGSLSPAWANRVTQVGVPTEEEPGTLGKPGAKG